MTQDQQADLPERQLRAVALECASKVVPEGAPSGHVLSSARMFETYIRTGLSQVGPRFKQGVQLGRTGATLRVDGNLTEQEADLIRDAVTSILTKGPNHGTEQG